MMDIKYDSYWQHNEMDEMVLWFTAPKEMIYEYLPDADYPEMVATAIEIVTPLNKIDAEHATVLISPTREDEYGQEDYDWTQIEMDKELINTLLVMADV